MGGTNLVDSELECGLTDREELVDERSESTPEGPHEPHSEGGGVHLVVVNARDDGSDLRVGRREPDQGGLDLHLLKQHLVVLQGGSVAGQEVLDLSADGSGEVGVVVVLEPGVLEDLDDFLCREQDRPVVHSVNILGEHDEI